MFTSHKKIFPKERNYTVGNKIEVEIMDGGAWNSFVVLTDHHNFVIKNIWATKRLNFSADGNLPDLISQYHVI